MVQFDMQAAGLNISSLKEFGVFKEAGSNKTQLKASKGISNYKILMFMVYNGEYFGLPVRVIAIGRKLLEIIGPGISSGERMECRHIAIEFIDLLEQIRAKKLNGELHANESLIVFWESLKNRPNLKNLIGFIDCEMWWHSQISLMALRYERENKVKYMYIWKK